MLPNCDNSGAGKIRCCRSALGDEELGDDELGDEEHGGARPMETLGIVAKICAMIGGLLLLAAPRSLAQELPTRTVRIIVPFTAGGANGAVARAMAERLAKRWGQSVIIENRPGGGTSIGTRAVIEAAPDGHTLLFTSS